MTTDRSPNIDPLTEYEKALIFLTRELNRTFENSDNGERATMLDYLDDVVRVCLPLVEYPVHRGAPISPDEQTAIDHIRNIRHNEYACPICKERRTAVTAIEQAVIRSATRERYRHE
jgi:hypothetical protein